MALLDDPADLLMRRALQAERFAESLYQVFEGIFLQLGLDLRKATLRHDPTGVGSRYQAGRLAKLIADARAEVLAAYRAAGADIRTDLEAFARLEARWITAQLGTVAVLGDLRTASLDLPELGRLIVREALIEGATIGEWWNRQAESFIRRFSDQMRMGLAAGESVDDMVRRIRGVSTGRRVTRTVGGKRRVYHVFEGGIMKTNTHRARSLVRTAANTVMARSHRAVYEANDDLVRGIYQSSTLDSRTTDICAAYNGMSWTLPDYKPIDGSLPYNGGLPRHWGERSVELPLLATFRELGIDRDELPPGMRASRDGPVPADTSFDAWFRRQSVEAQNAQFGAGRAQLFREGRITIRDLLDQRGRPLTLAELEAAA